jgi:hypothetical protein
MSIEEIRRTLDLCCLSPEGESCNPPEGLCQERELLARVTKLEADLTAAEAERDKAWQTYRDTEEECTAAKREATELDARVRELKGQCVRWDAMYQGMMAERDGYQADLTAAQGVIEGLRGALQWCSGSDDFAEGGQARIGWLKLCAPLLAAPALSAPAKETDNG